MAEPSMRSFWDDRAREDAIYFVDNRQKYSRPDLDRFFAEGERALDQLLDLGGVKLRPGDTVVEIGCGVGRFTRALASRAERVVGLDVSGEMLERARELNSDLGNVDWIQGDGATLTGVVDGSADACVSAVVFQHLPSSDITLSYIREIGRALKPGGRAAIQFSNDPDIHRHKLRLKVTLRGLLGRGPRGQRNRAWLGSSLRLDDLRRNADEAGLDVGRVSGEGTLFCVAGLSKRGAQSASSSS